MRLLKVVRNLLRSAGTCLKDVKAPPQFVPVSRRLDAACDNALRCALPLPETNKLELKGQGSRLEAMEFLAKTLQLRGNNAATAKVFVPARNANRYDDAPNLNEMAVALALKWADRVHAETESWFQKNLPLSLKHELPIHRPVRVPRAGCFVRGRRGRGALRCRSVLAAKSVADSLCAGLQTNPACRGQRACGTAPGTARSSRPIHG